jgi:hypothetical protein
MNIERTSEEISKNYYPLATMEAEIFKQKKRKRRYSGRRADLPEGTSEYY